MSRWNDLHTPCYIIDKQRLDKNTKDLQEGFRKCWGAPVIFGYSVKTNSLPWMITYMKAHGFLAEVVSEQEYRLARRLGFDIHEIVLNGPVKSEELLLEALNGGAYVNLDNFEEIAVIERRVAERAREWKVGLRYSFELEEVCPGETIVGKEHSRFGFHVESGAFGEAVTRLKCCKGVQITGLHGHSSTRTKSLGIFGAIAGKAAELMEKYNLQPEYVDIGGGFFGDKPGAPDYQEYGDVIAKAFRDRAQLKLIVEPGASLVSSPIGYLTRVVNVRDAGEMRFATLDGSNVHINPQFHNISFQKELLLADNEREKRERQTLCGYTCIEMDRLGKLEMEKELKTGDKIFFKNCGSYSMTLAPLFISYFPRVYVDDGTKCKCVREAWSEEEFLQKCEVYR